MEKMKYRISSRATILLGRESVSKVDGAVIELVKNTYDADATLCFIYFDIKNDYIHILDNGMGMTKEIIENHWMMIGTDNKRKEYKSLKNRIKSGEKGIGRFALDRLGSKCEMITKNESSLKTILWKTDWENFEEPGKVLDEVEAEFSYLETNFIDNIPSFIVEDIKAINENEDLDFEIELDTGTLLKISGLRDNWLDEGVSKIIKSMGFLIPPIEQNDYIICIKQSEETPYKIIENEISDEYDYKLSAIFDGENFNITLFRNEFDLNKIPTEVFKLEEFQLYPYRYKDFEDKKFLFKYSISDLMRNNNPNIIESVKKIGSFKFNYIFMKLSLQDDSKDTFYYKGISNKRKIWLENHGGIKIYRDNFLVRPYGDPMSDSFDWLGLDAIKANSPAAISHPTGRWKVRNKQGQGTVLISRIFNDCILDKSSREGIIENEYFTVFKNVINNIISIFEQDRAYIGRAMKRYADIINEKEKTKQEGQDISKKILENRENISSIKDKSTHEEVEVLAKAVKFYEEEREELITEIKMLRSLATNGLITSSIVHDLKGIGAILVNRVDSLNYAIENDNKNLIDRNLKDLLKNDTFLKAWINVVTSHMKKDKRNRTKKDVYEVIKDIIEVMSPILDRKKINYEINEDKNKAIKKIFESDFESIIYNLVINSIEAFEKTKISERKITITMETNDNIIIHYRDNGSGLGEIYKNPYDIFTFGETSKVDKDGKIIGTGLGMYIVASTVREYNAKYVITEYKSGFGLDLIFPI